MPTMNLRQLRNTRRLKAWLRAGKTVELKERNQTIARIVPHGTGKRRGKMPDFAAMRREIFGDRILPAVELFIKERGRF